MQPSHMNPNIISHPVKINNQINDNTRMHNIPSYQVGSNYGTPKFTSRFLNKRETENPDKNEMDVSFHQIIQGIRNFLTNSQQQNYDDDQYNDDSWKEKFSRKKRSFSNSTDTISRKKRSVIAGEVYNPNQDPYYNPNLIELADDGNNNKHGLSRHYTCTIAKKKRKRRRRKRSTSTTSSSSFTKSSSLPINTPMYQVPDLILPKTRLNTAWQ